MFYVFVWQLNTTYGTPHKTTGRHNIYGDLIAFDTIKERDHYHDNFYSNNGFESCVKTNKRDAKSQFFAGMTQHQFNDYLQYVDNAMVYSDCN